MPGMIVAPQPVAVEEGAKVLMSGGNAVDAAVTCALVQSVLSPHMCGIGGYIIATLHLAQRFRGEAGGCWTPPLWPVPRSLPPCGRRRCWDPIPTAGASS